VDCVGEIFMVPIGFDRLFELGNSKFAKPVSLIFDRKSKDFGMPDEMYFGSSRRSSCVLGAAFIHDVNIVYNGLQFNDSGFAFL
jgi:hypothetical protein